MECKNEIRQCPNNWSDCSLCRYEAQCNAGLYHGETEEPIIIKAAKIATGVIDAEVKKNVESIRGDRHARFMALSPSAGLREFYKLKTDDLHYKEPYKAMAGAIVLGGGSKSSAKKSKKGNKPTVYAWGTTL